MKKFFFTYAFIALGAISFSANATTNVSNDITMETVECTYNIPSRGISVTAPTCAQARAGAMAAL